ncbi:MAG: NAD(P)-dependent oxidoreductase, partial [Clostridiaceae bacterium]
FQDSNNFQWVEMEDLYKNSDFITLHVPLSKETEEMINLSALGKMKSSVIIINTARGGLIHEEALAEALNSGRIAGAALDVLSTEPPSEDNPLLKAKNCIITPHIAWAAREARNRLMNIAVNNLEGYINGNVKNCVNE